MKFLQDLSLTTASKLIRDGADIEKLNKILASKPSLALEANNFGNTLLHLACHHGRLDLCIVLLLRGADINRADINGFTPLMVGVQFDNIECAKMLIAKGATVGIKNNKANSASLSVHIRMQ